MTGPSPSARGAAPTAAATAARRRRASRAATVSRCAAWHASTNPTAAARACALPGTSSRPPESAYDHRLPELRRDGRCRRESDPRARLAADEARRHSLDRHRLARLASPARGQHGPRHHPRNPGGSMSSATVSAAECGRCKGSRRLLMASGKVTVCECACTTCGGSGYAGEVCGHCRGSGREPACAVCSLPLSRDEIEWSERTETEPLCDHCVALRDEKARKPDTIPAPPLDYRLAYQAACARSE